MARTARSIVGLFALLAVVAVAAAAARAQGLAPGISVSVRGEPAQPGAVLALTLTSAVDLSSVHARLLERTIVFARGESPRVWRAMAGIDVADPAGSATLLVTSTLGDGTTILSTRTLDVMPRPFPSRSLRVAGRFVDPSPQEVARIRTEADRLEAIFGTVTLPDWIETFVPPVPGAAGHNFGSRSVFNGEVRAPHAGEDFRGAAGTPVAAPGGGRVVLAEDLFFTGQTVVIDHGFGLYSLLAHLSRIDVPAGTQVARGDAVGLLGATGRVTGPHLHWTVRLGGARVDPLRLLALLAPAQSGAASGQRPSPPAK